MMPKFKIEYETNLVSHFKDFGVTKIFQESNDFNKIIDYKCQVSEIIHKTFINVDEIGTEASAFTGFKIKDLSYTFPIEFILNRPFGFFIVDIEKDLLLFAGVYGVK